MSITPDPAPAADRPPVADRPPAADCIVLRGVTGFGRHGVLSAERAAGQPFVVDLTAHLDLAPAAHSDRLSDTLDYAGLAQQIVADIEGDPLDLIEALAGRIATSALRHDRVQTVEVTVHKPQAPMPVPVGDTAVTLTRRRTP